MAETSWFWDNPGTGDAPAVGYGMAELCDDSEVFSNLFYWEAIQSQFLLRGWRDELSLTDGGGLNLTVGTGGAVCYGYLYDNDAPVTLALPNNQTRYIYLHHDTVNQTIRVDDIAFGGLVPTFTLGVVTTLAGAITVITPWERYATFQTAVAIGGVSAASLEDDAVDTTILADVTRQRLHGAGQLEPDATNPATRVAQTTFPRYPYGDRWQFVDAAPSAVWLVERVPADFSGTDVDIYIWANKTDPAITGDVRWEWSSYDAQPSAIFANQTGNAEITYNETNYDELERSALGTMTLAAGDLVCLQISRNGAHGNDTLAGDVYLVAVELEYTADS